MGIFTLIGACLLILLLPIILYCGLGYLLAPFYKKLDERISDATINLLEYSSILCDINIRVDEMEKTLEWISKEF